MSLEHLLIPQNRKVPEAPAILAREWRYQLQQAPLARLGWMGRDQSSLKHIKYAYFHDYI